MTAVLQLRRHVTRRAGLCLLAALTAGPAWSAPGKTTVLDTEYDDARVGREASRSVEAQVGVLPDPELNAYVEGIGRKLLRAIPRRSFQYRFRVVDQVEPNAFALPGGYIFVSRGLLALANDEDELACVLGHEITHVAKRHAAAQQAVERGKPQFVWPWLRAGRRAAYSRDLERSADRGGQILCSAAGYDPRGMSTFLESLLQHAKLQTGFSRNASFLDTHPSPGRRSTIAAVQASELRWRRDPALGDPRAALLRKIEGLPVGQRPESGVFRGDVFLHPDLDFKLRFPRRWRKSNTNLAVGAQAPRGNAVVFLMGDVPPGEPRQVAEAWARKAESGQGRLRDSKPFTVGRTRAWRLELDSHAGGALVRSYVTFIPHRGSIFRITGAGVLQRELERTLATTRSFRSLTDEDRAAVTSTRLRIVEALPGEDVKTLSKRSGNAWDAFATVIYNGLSPSQRFEGGELVKIAKIQPYRSKPPTP